MAGAGDGKTRRLGLTEPYNHAQTASGKLRVKQGAWLGEAISLRIEGWAGGGGGRLSLSMAPVPSLGCTDILATRDTLPVGGAASDSRF